VIWKRYSVLVVLLAVGAAGAAAQDQTKGGGAEAPNAPKVLPGANDPAVNNAAVDQSTYIIGPNDVLDIEVFREKDWSKYYPVRTDGMITIPLIGEMRASGLTPKQLETQLTEAFKSQVKEPNVTVSVYDVRSKKYSITGEVKRGGDYPLIKNPTTVFEAIVSAGGFLDQFSHQTATVMRGTQRFEFSYKDYVKGKHMEKNIPLENGDTVIVR
jgi:polysaccharide biosynthesis/export protein